MIRSTSLFDNYGVVKCPKCNEVIFYTKLHTSRKFYHSLCYDCETPLDGTCLVDSKDWTYTDFAKIMQIELGLMYGYPVESLDLPHEYVRVLEHDKLPPEDIKIRLIELAQALHIHKEQ